MALHGGKFTSNFGPIRKQLDYFFGIPSIYFFPHLKLERVLVVDEEVSLVVVQPAVPAPDEDDVLRG